MKITLGQRIYYTGDVANVDGTGTVVAVRPPSRFAEESYDIDMDDGRTKPSIFGSMFDPSPGRRFWPLDEWLADRRKRIEQMKAEMQRIAEGRGMR